MPAPCCRTQNLIDEIEDALSSASEEKRANALWRITDLFIAGSETYTKIMSRCSTT